MRLAKRWSVTAREIVLTADLDKTAQEAMRGLGSEFKNLGDFMSFRKL